MSDGSLRPISRTAEVRAQISTLRRAGKSIAFVPTMGALHDGHLTLVDVAHQHADAVVVSIFVNPLQFAPTEDLTKYPRTLTADLDALHTHDVALVFTPTADEMYPPGSITTVTPAPYDAIFEGAIRPGHFTGVLTIVAKLFNIVHPDVAVFGQKDLQQLSLIQHMVRDLDISLQILSVPTVRDPDGLAMSSRNRYLTPADRLRAPRVNATLCAIRSLFETGEHNSTTLLQTGTTFLAEDPAFTLDYLALVDPTTFTPVPTATPGTAAIIAARLNGTRLLDNIIL
jgi:pantoate--beta-alanine ligase